MSESEKTTVNGLIARVEAAATETAAVIEACSEKEWRTRLIDQDRTVGVTIYHVVASNPFLADWALQVAQGEPLPAWSMEDIDRINAREDLAAAGVTREEALALLRENTQTVGSKLSALDDDDLARTAVLPMNGRPISVQQVVEWFIINHAYGHLQEVREVLGTA